MSTAEERLRIDVGGGASVSALRSPALAGEARAVLVYAPGAGSNLNDPFGAYLASALTQDGVECWRFQFPYMEAKRGGPDRPAVLEASWRAVIGYVAAAGLPVVAGGRSMGGRIASQVVAQGTAVAALALFAYPLHPPGRPQQPRDAHLPAITAPTLFCCGTRDVYGTPDELRLAASLVAGSRLHLLEGADHGFAVLKASGRSRTDVWAEAVQALRSFLMDESIH